MKDMKPLEIGFIFLLASIFLFGLVFHLQQIEINDLQEDLINTNEARIRAEEKPCCKIIQERYIDRRLSEDGLTFIYEEHPQIMECE